MIPLQLLVMNGKPSTVYPNRCLLQRNSEAKCKYCLDACPKNAIKFDRRAPSLNFELCSGCGLCLVACPVECFEAGEWSERSLVRDSMAINQPVVEVACNSHPNPAAGNEGSQLIQISSCLGAVSPGLWFEIALRHSIKLRLEYCSACPMEKGASYAKRGVELANTWLKSSGRALTPERSVIIQEASVPSDGSSNRGLVSEGRPTISRRDFLFGFARSSGPAKLALKNLFRSSEIIESFQKVAPHIPSWLFRLSEVYPKSDISVSDDGCKEANVENCINWPTLSISDDCAACMSCSTNCPSGALTTKNIDGQYQHLFSPGFCVGCGLCAQVCPTQALSRNYYIDDQPFSERIIAERQVVPCRKCGSPAVKKGDLLCYCCANEPKINSVMDSARGYLFKT